MQVSWDPTSLVQAFEYLHLHFLFSMVEEPPLDLLRLHSFPFFVSTNRSLNFHPQAGAFRYSSASSQHSIFPVPLRLSFVSTKSYFIFRSTSSLSVSSLASLFPLDRWFGLLPFSKRSFTISVFPFLAAIWRQLISFFWKTALIPDTAPLDNNNRTYRIRIEVRNITISIWFFITANPKGRTLSCAKAFTLAPYWIRSRAASRLPK